MIQIGRAVIQDVPAIALLMDELDRFYGAEEVEPPEVREPQIRAAVFGDLPSPQVLLAWDGSEVAGFASYSSLWPASGVTSSLFLKELYVRTNKRRLGVGRALMRAISQTAATQGCSRVEWTTERTNDDAIAFYSSLGAAELPDKTFFRIEREAILAAVDGHGLGQ